MEKEHGKIDRDTLMDLFMAEMKKKVLYATTVQILQEEKERICKIAFRKSKYLNNDGHIVSLAYDLFSDRFKGEWNEFNADYINGIQIVALDHREDKMFSILHPGDYASIEEAIDIIIERFLKEI